jgi:hypothetical protein
MVTVIEFLAFLEYGIDFSHFKIQLVEVLPSALVLYILRKLPPRRISAQYHAIH